MSEQAQSPPLDSAPPDEPRTQERRDFRAGWPVWLKQLPRFKFPPPKDNFQLIDLETLEDFFKESNIPDTAADRIRQDIKHMDYELLRLFRERDYEAKFHQNRYRIFQLGYIALATLATLVGSLIALSLNANASLVPFLAFVETIIALATTYLASVSGREPPLPLWMDNRRRAEYLRREYFRYLMNLEPYDELTGYEREMRLSKRAARINKGFTPDDEGA
ncbi:MAG: DUF4231 domain-containing protein [Chloroflexota bacterium]